MNKARIARIVVLIASVGCFIACTAMEKDTAGVPLMLTSFVLLAVYLILLVSAIAKHFKRKKEEKNTVHIYAEIITPTENDKKEIAISQYSPK